ncbi:MAG: hypothetical protein BWZ06_01891 [Bacteroidetes bacterium ADurb.BinA261]|nr:MAG: hypothetical protein BWZ06_01891 [Bacteroidetes bacterium ADurb.BinA261]
MDNAIPRKLQARAANNKGIEKSQNDGDDNCEISDFGSKCNTHPDTLKRRTVMTDANVMTRFFLYLSTMVPNNMLDKVTSNI